MTRTRGIVVGVMLSLLSIGLSILLLEFAAGLLYEKASYANGKRTVAYYQGKASSAESKAAESDYTSLMPHPYLLYTNVPNFRGAGWGPVSSNSPPRSNDMPRSAVRCRKR